MSKGHSSTATGVGLGLGTGVSVGRGVAVGTRVGVLVGSGVRVAVGGQVVESVGVTVSISIGDTGVWLGTTTPWPGVAVGPCVGVVHAANSAATVIIAGIGFFIAELPSQGGGNRGWLSTVQ